MVLNQSFKPTSKRIIRSDINTIQLKVNDSLPDGTPHSNKKLNMVEKTRHSDIMQAMQDQASRAGT